MRPGIGSRQAPSPSRIERPSERVQAIAIAKALPLPRTDGDWAHVRFALRCAIVRYDELYAQVAQFIFDTLRLNYRVCHRSKANEGVPVRDRLRRGWRCGEIGAEGHCHGRREPRELRRSRFSHRRRSKRRRTTTTSGRGRSLSGTCSRRPTQAVCRRRARRAQPGNPARRGLFPTSRTYPGR